MSKLSANLILSVTIAIYIIGCQTVIGYDKNNDIEQLTKSTLAVEENSAVQSTRDLPEDESFSWEFEHTLIDNDPPATYRINDIQIGDIDGDNLPDIWTTGRGAGKNNYQMVWYKNPTWQRFEITKGDYKYGALGDLDNDGDLDIVAGSDNDAQVYWFENNGSPQEIDWPKFSLGIRGKPDLIIVADVNNDKYQDLIIMYKDRLVWAMNPQSPKNAWPTFDLWKGDIRAGGSVFDLDQDGDQDIIYGNAWFENPLPGGDPKQGSSWVMRIIDARWPTQARSAVGDLNGDGIPDVVLSDEEGSKGIVWYLGSLNISDSSWNRNDIVRHDYEGIHSLALSDFDLDGDLDIFAAEMHHGKNPDKISVFENIDADSNMWIEHILGDFGSHNAKVVDMNGDGYPDIVGKNYQAEENPLRIDLLTFNLGEDMSRKEWKKYIIDSNRPGRAVFIDAGDIDNDSLPDIVTGAWWYKNPGELGMDWTRNKIGEGFYNMAVTYDFDRDGDIDILGTKDRLKSASFVWAENNGTGKFILHDNLPVADGDFLQGARAAELFPNGEIGVVLSWHNRTSTQIYKVPKKPNGSWLWQVISSTTNGEQIALGDLDYDGDLDIHLGTHWLQNSGGDWKTLKVLAMGDPEADPDRVELADIDLDGDLDVVIGAEHARRLVWAESPSDPKKPWIEHVISTQSLAMSLDVGDIDKDGDADIVIGEHNTKEPNIGNVYIFLNESNGLHWTAVKIDSDLEHHDGTQLVDIDNDGDLDILSIGWLHSKVVLYENPLYENPGQNLP
jgi:hypothetical protein